MGVDGYRAFISRAANLFMKIFFPIPGLKEYSCGYRGYRYSKIRKPLISLETISYNSKGWVLLAHEKLVKLKLIGAKFGEIPFLHRYDQKQSDSKMVSSVTTFGYLVMTILYHWPKGGKVQFQRNIFLDKIPNVVNEVIGFCPRKCFFEIELFHPPHGQ